jgi:transposase, IS30 family
MGQSYNQLSQEERAQIHHWHANGESARQIGLRLGRHHGSVSRELERNGKPTKQFAGGYEPFRAHDRALRRRRRDCRFKLARQPALQKHVKQHLAMGWSPEAIAGRLARDKASMSISHESIYRFIEQRIRNEDYTWHTLLPRRKFYRGRRPRKGGAPSKTFAEYVSIEKRPAFIDARKRAGNWEVDLMAFRHNTMVFLIAPGAHERKTRMTLVWRQPNKGAKAVRKNLCTTFRHFPQNLRHSFTYDNGTEFAQHHLINAAIGTKSYFCHTHSPWEKGSVENIIGRLRRDWPRKTDINTLTPAQIRKVINKHNNIPRKCLGYLKPVEAWNKIMHSSTVALQT